MIEAIEVPLGSTKIRAFADSQMVLYCTKIDSEDKLKLNERAWNHVNAFVHNRKERIMNAEKIKKEMSVNARDVYIGQRQCEKWQFDEEPRPSMVKKEPIDISSFITSGGKIVNY